MYNLVKTYKINILKKQIAELENKNKILIELNNQSKYIIETQKDQISSYANNKTIFKELQKSFENDITNIIESKNNQLVLFSNNILQKLDTHIKCNYEAVIHEQEEKINKQIKELKIRETIITHLRNKDLDTMLENYNEN
jgi:hypothetical protein